MIGTQQRRLSRIEALSLAEANEWLLAHEAMGEIDRQCELVEAERLGRNHELAAGFWQSTATTTTC